MKFLDLQISQQQYMRLAKGSMYLPYLVLTPLLFLQIGLALWHYHTSWLMALACIGVGFPLWGMLEYLLHRFSFHANIQHGLIKFFTSGFHNLHHQVPQSKEYIVTPIYLILLVKVIADGLLYLLTDHVATALLLSAGVTLGYMYYEWVHFLCHHRTPKTKYYQHLKEWHLQHHFKTPKKNFGVSYPLWDFVLRSGEKP